MKINTIPLNIGYSRLPNFQLNIAGFKILANIFLLDLRSSLACDEKSTVLIDRGCHSKSAIKF